MDVRNDFESIEQQANLLTDNIRYKARIKKKTRKLQFDESNINDTLLKGRKLFIVETHNIICDKITADF